MEARKRDQAFEIVKLDGLKSACAQGFECWHMGVHRGCDVRINLRRQVKIDECGHRRRKNRNSRGCDQRQAERNHPASQARQLAGDHQHHRHQRELRQQGLIAIAGKLGQQWPAVDEIEISAPIQAQRAIDRIKLSVAIGEVRRHRGVGQQNAKQQDEQHLRCRLGDRAEMRVRSPITVENAQAKKAGDGQRQPRTAEVDREPRQRETHDCHQRHRADQAPDQRRACGRHRYPAPTPTQVVMGRMCLKFFFANALSLGSKPLI